VYDLAGNLTADGSLSLSYDAENRITSTAGVTYSYDGDGRRVKKSNGKLYWYGPGLDALLETDLAGNTPTEFVFFGGKRIARRDSSGAISYFFADHLGSSRVITNASGTVVEDSDFYPFGGARVVVNNDPNPYKFTGHERDGESGLDYMKARYYSSSFGRFLQPDWSSTPTPVPYADFSSPQSLNLYAYVGNNPLNLTDPDGHCCSSSASSIADWLDDKISTAVDFYRDRAVASGNSGVAGAATFIAGATGDIAKGFTNLLRTGESVGSLPDNASAGQIITAVAEEGGRVGGTILAVVSVAGPRTQATPEQGAQVAGEIGRNRVTLENGSVVDLAGKAHFEKSTQQSVPTPHIKDATVHTGPTGQSSLTYGPTRPATVGDVNAAARAAGAKPPVTIPPALPVPRQERENQ
jgi:RHS repeat-associated protein